MERTPQHFRATARVAFMAAHLATLVEVLGIVLGVGALVVAIALGGMDPASAVTGLELVGVGALVGTFAGLSWWLEQRPTKREALWRVDDWFELEGALVTAWELERGLMEAPSFQASLSESVARVVVDIKEVGRAGFAMTMPILLVPLAGAAVLVGAQEERAELVAALTEAFAQDGGSTVGQGQAAAAGDASELRDFELSEAPEVAPPLGVELEDAASAGEIASDLGASENDPRQVEIKQLKDLRANLKTATPASAGGAPGAMSPQARRDFEQRIDERIAALEAGGAAGESADGEPEEAVSETSGSEGGSSNPSNPSTDSASGVTDGSPEGRIRGFQGVSPTGVWWPERQDEIVSSWLRRLVARGEAGE
jgi:hypothetical protein